jgi:hypothetical protein
MTHGGKRKNAGRKEGEAIPSLIKRKFKDYYSEKEIIDIINLAKVKAKEHPDVLKYVLDQLFGKAPQNIQMTGEDGGKIQIEVSEAIAKKNGIV